MSIDFATGLLVLVVGLPISNWGNERLLVCVDRFTEAIHRACYMKDVTAQQLLGAGDVPECVYTDCTETPLTLRLTVRGTLFTSNFWNDDAGLYQRAQ